MGSRSSTGTRPSFRRPSPSCPPEASDATHESLARMKMKTIQFTTKVSCAAGHAWAPRSMQGTSGSLRDSTILAEHFTTPIRTTFDLHEFGKCPVCDDAACAISFEAMPGEMDVPDDPAR